MFLDGNCCTYIQNMNPKGRMAMFLNDSDNLQEVMKIHSHKYNVFGIHVHKYKYKI